MQEAQAATAGRVPGIRRPGKNLRALGRVRQRLHRFYLLSGLTRVCVAALLALFFSFALDYLLQLPWGVRALFLASGLSGLVVVCVRWVLTPVAQVVSDNELASLVEECNPELKQALITAVQLSHPGSEGARYVSQSLVETVVEDVERQARGASFARVFKLGGLRRYLAALGGLLLIAVVGVANSPHLFAVWARRDLLLLDTSWPQSTDLELDPSTPLVVAIGDDLPVAVRLLKGRPNTVTVERTVAGRTSRSRSMDFRESNSWDVFVAEIGPESSEVEQVLNTLGLQRERSGRVAYGVSAQEAEKLKTSLEAAGATARMKSYDVFHHEFKNVSEPFSFFVRGGDDSVGPVTIEVRLQPRIDMRSVRIRYDYPAYTGREAEDERPQRHANVKVPVGTRVSYRMSTNIPVRRVIFVLYQHEEGRPPREKPADEQTIREDVAIQEAESPAGKTVTAFSGTFEVERSGYYYFELIDESGFQSDRPQKFRVQAIPDRKPQVRIVEPQRITEDVSVDALVPVKVVLNDDYGIRNGVLQGVYFPPMSDNGVPQSISIPGVLAATPREAKAEHEAELILKVAELETAAGTSPESGGRFEFFATGEDFGATGRTRDDGSPVGNIGESQVHRLQIVDKAQLERSLTDEIMIVRDQLRELLNRQMAVRKDLESFQREALLAGSIETKDAHKLSPHQHEQRRITEGLQRQVRELERVLAKMEANAVGDKEWKSWIKGIADEIADVADRKSTAVEKSLQDLRRDARTSPQENKRLLPILTSQRQIERDLRALVIKLSDFGERSALIQLLRDLRQRQAELRDQTRDEAEQRGAGAPEKK